MVDLRHVMKKKKVVVIMDAVKKKKVVIEQEIQEIVGNMVNLHVSRN